MSILFELTNIRKYYDGKMVLNIEKLSIEDNQIIGFFGPNGSGKSTLFSLLSFVDKPTSGSLFFNGVCCSKIDNNLKRDVVMVPQNPYLLKRSVYDNVAYGLKLRGDKKDVKNRVLEALSLVGLDSSFSKRTWSQLSGGEAQRVALAARLILKPKVLILDEPTTGVDTNSAQLIKEAILNAKQKYNTTILISSHDHNWLNHICDKRVALFQGELVESGSVNLLFAPWSKDENGDLQKVFLDGQKLTIPNTKNKKRDSIVMVNSEDITICSKDCEEFVNDTTLIGIINSMSKQQSDDSLLISFSIAGISFSCKISKEEMKKQRIFPGDEVNVNIDLSNICWI